MKRLSQLPIRQCFSVNPEALNVESDRSCRVVIHNSNGVAALGDTGRDDKVTRKTTPDQQLAGTATDQEARFARVVRACGDDPASLLLMISVMERIIADRNLRRQTDKIAPK